jgi:hypothetical protein
MSKINDELLNGAIELWKYLGVEFVSVPFNCGGDSMNEIEFELYDKNKNRITEPSQEVGELLSYFDNVIYDEVDFYVNSDGHYQGEYGTVEITFNDENFDYYKDSTEEYEETYSDTMKVELSVAELDVLQKVSNVNGGDDWGNTDTNINYKEDCIITDEEETILGELTEKIDDLARDFDIDTAVGEYIEDTTTWQSDINIVDNHLLVEVSGRFRIEKND